ncbi:hypothetical protein ATR1_134d0001, partial [Acetobacter tropicalis]
EKQTGERFVRSRVRSDRFAEKLNSGFRLAPNTWRLYSMGC